MPDRTAIIVAITGASGAIYGVRALEILSDMGGFETHLIVTPDGLRTARLETGLGLDGLKALADIHHNDKDTGACVASGSFASVDEATDALVHVTQRARPDPTHAARYREIHAIYRGLYADLKARFRALAALD